MPPSLLLLLRLRFRAALRRVFRAGSAKRLVITIIGVAMFLTWLLPQLLFGLLSKTKSPPEPVLLIGPLILGALCLTPILLGTGFGAVAFSPAETDFLFPGPFSRRQLLAYKLASALGGICLMSVFFSVFCLRFAGSWPGALLAGFTTLVFAHLLSTAVALVRTRIAESLYTRARRVALILLVLAVAVAGWRAAQDVTDRNPMEIVRQIRAAPAARVILAPFDVYIRALVARDIASLALWTGVGWGINALILLLVFRLDADYLEASIAAWQKMHERIRRVRSGGAWSASITPRSAKRRVPPLPYLAGAGPLIWRQLTGAVRGARAAITMIIVGAITMTLMFQMGRHHGGPETAPTQSGGELVVFALIWLTLVLASTFRFDFRADLEHIDSLKVLPISSVAVAAGQLTVPVLLLGTLQVVVVGTLAALGALRLEHALIACAAAPIGSFLWLAADNFVFLLAPSRPPTGAIDFQAVGRQALLMLAKTTLFALAGGAVVLAGYLAYLAAGESRIAAALAGLLVLAAAAFGLLQAVAWAFRRLDPSMDLPA